MASYYTYGLEDASAGDIDVRRVAEELLARRDDVLQVGPVGDIALLEADRRARADRVVPGLCLGRELEVGNQDLGSSSMSLLDEGEADAWERSVSDSSERSEGQLDGRVPDPPPVTTTILSLTGKLPTVMMEVGIGRCSYVNWNGVDGAQREASFLARRMNRAALGLKSGEAPRGNSAGVPEERRMRAALAVRRLVPKPLKPA
jgi:hypothetical protein